MLLWLYGVIHHTTKLVIAMYSSLEPVRNQNWAGTIEQVSQIEDK